MNEMVSPVELAVPGEADWDDSSMSMVLDRLGRIAEGGCTASVNFIASVTAHDV